MTAYIPTTDPKRANPVLREGMRLLMEDDLEGAVKKLAMVQLAAPTLSFLKDSYGSEWIQQHNFDTTLATKEYGHDWLSR